MQDPEAGASWSVEDITHYDSLAQPLLTYLCRYAANQQDVEDLLLVVFVAALNDVDFSDLPPQRCLRWLRNVARNTLNNRYRQHKVPLMALEDDDVDVQDEQTVPAQVLLSSSEQEALIMRVRTRLQNYEDLPAPGVAARMIPGKWLLHTNWFVATWRQGRFAPLFNVLVIVLIIAIVATGSLLLFKPPAQPQSYSQSQIAIGTGDESASSPTSASYSVMTTNGRLDETMQINPGPYFFGEIIAIDFTITNLTGVTLHTLDNECPAAYGLDTPSFQALPIPVSTIETGGQCTALKLAPGRAITLHSYLVLPTRGQENLHANARLHASATDDAQLTGIYDALAVQGPMIPLQIANTAPPARMITVTQKLHSNKHTMELLIHAPAAARAHLLYWTNMVCQNLAALKSSGELGSWHVLTTTIIQQPSCLGPHQAWDYAIGAPGYGITQGKYQG